MIDLSKVMQRECLHSEHAARCFVEAKRRDIAKAKKLKVKTEKRHNAEVSGAGTASAGLPGYAAGGNGERK